MTNRALPTGDHRLGALYDRPIPSRRTGAVYNAFSYPTKIDPEAIALFIAAHTAPGDSVLDVFAGSGTTGVAARLCETPTPEMKRRAVELGLPVEWGPRHLGPFGPRAEAPPVVLSTSAVLADALRRL